MSTINLKSGLKFKYMPTGVSFEIKEVTNKRVSWWTGFLHKSSWGKNIMKTAWTSRSIFEQGIKNGTYQILG